jgi:hypothetical protein
VLRFFFSFTSTGIPDVVIGMTDIFHGGDVGNIVVQIANNLANKNPFVHIGQAFGQVTSGGSPTVLMS